MTKKTESEIAAFSRQDKYTVEIMEACRKAKLKLEECFNLNLLIYQRSASFTRSRRDVFSE